MCEREKRPARWKWLLPLFTGVVDGGGVSFLVPAPPLVSFGSNPPPNLCVGGGFKRKKEDEGAEGGRGEKRGVYTGFTVRTVESSLLLNSLTKKKCLPVVGGHAERKREGEEEIRGRGGGFLNCVTVTLPLRPRKRSRMSVCGSNAQFLGGRGRPTDFSSSSCPIDRPT